MSQLVLEWIGYVASGLIALSMMVSSILKFRWINLAGAVLFSFYGFMIGAIPVGVLNGLIACVNLYYLWTIYSRSEVFETLEIMPGSEYLLRFLEFHHADIQLICPGFRYQPAMNTMSYFILRNMAVAGIFLAHKEGDTLVVGLDYVIPEYRDFKNGRYLYRHLKPMLKELGFQKVKAGEKNPANDYYFKKLGFSRDEDGLYTMAV